MRHFFQYHTNVEIRSWMQILSGLYILTWSLPQMLFHNPTAMNITLALHILVWAPVGFILFRLYRRWDRSKHPRFCNYFDSLKSLGPDQ